ncbi:MAG: hypothetical protein OXG78_14580 [Chloroflexi bacterium]|nr:hypothetical protein [Chloroflexota bacterium]
MLKKSLMLALLVVLLSSLAGVQADTNERPDLCGSLPQTDCQILVENENSWMSLNSFGFSFSMDITADADESMHFTGQGAGAFEIDSEANQTLIEMNENLSAVDIGALVELMLTSVEGKISFEFSVSGGDEDLDTAMTLLLKDGVVVIDAAALEALTGEPMGGLEAFGIDLNGALDEAFDELGVMDLSELNATSEAEVAATTVSRLPDEEIRGDAVAVFESTINVETLFSLVSLEELVAASNDLDDPEEVAALIEAMEFGDFSIREYIGLENRYTYRVEITMAMTVSGEASELDGDASIVMDMSMEVFDFNVPVNVEIPEDAFVFPLAMMMAMGDQ